MIKAFSFGRYVCLDETAVSVRSVHAFFGKWCSRSEGRRLFAKVTFSCGASALFLLATNLSDKFRRNRPAGGRRRGEGGEEGGEGRVS